MKKIDLTLNAKAKNYVQTLAEIKSHIKEAQVKAALSANKELLKLYWYIGKTINEHQRQNNWKAGDLEKLAKDLQNSFPGMAGFSSALYQREGKAITNFKKTLPKPSSRIHSLILILRF